MYNTQLTRAGSSGNHAASVEPIVTVPAESLISHGLNVVFVVIKLDKKH